MELDAGEKGPGGAGARETKGALRIPGGYLVESSPQPPQMQQASEASRLLPKDSRETTKSLGAALSVNYMPIVERNPVEVILEWALLALETYVILSFLGICLLVLKAQPYLIPPLFRRHYNYYAFVWFAVADLMALIVGLAVMINLQRFRFVSADQMRNLER
jgi:hypothetical protein